VTQKCNKQKHWCELRDFIQLCKLHEFNEEQSLLWHEMG
jgi:hypothetical protein